jgi:hypothetical protein
LEELEVESDDGGEFYILKDNKVKIVSSWSEDNEPQDDLVIRSQEDFDDAFNS